MSTDDLEVPLVYTGIEAPFAAGMFRALVEDPERERRLKEFVLMAFATMLEEVTLGDCIAKWQLGEKEHGVMTEEQMRNFPWMENAKMEVVDTKNYLMPSFFRLVHPKQ